MATQKAGNQALMREILAKLPKEERDIDAQSEVQYNNTVEQFSRKPKIGYRWAFDENLLKQGVKSKARNRVSIAKGNFY